SSIEATSSFITPRCPIPSLSNLAASPILRQEGTSSLITHRSITTRLEPEDLNNPFFLPPYNEDTTETDPVPPVIVDINSPNEEPIRIPTPEAPLINQPDPVNEAPLPLLPSIQNLPLSNNMAQAQALTDAANAINALAVALGQDKKIMKEEPLIDTEIVVPLGIVDSITNLMIDPGHKDEIDPKEEILTAMIDPE
ncbi:27886_t:CDS:2, partial [Gigaspora margarita]